MRLKVYVHICMWSCPCVDIVCINILNLKQKILYLQIVLKTRSQWWEKEGDGRRQLDFRTTIAGINLLVNKLSLALPPNELLHYDKSWFINCYLLKMTNDV